MQILLLTQALCAILLGVSFNTDAKPNGLRIVNGDEVNSHEFPFIAFITVKGPQNLQSRCGGSIITQHHVLTARHCVKSLEILVPGGKQYYDARNEDVTVYVGVHNIQHISTDIDRGIVQNTGVLNIDSPAGATNDIALLTLSEGIVYNEFANKICLPPSVSKLWRFPRERDTATIIGWGITGQYMGASDTLQKLETSVLMTTESAMYTSTLTQAVCKGDSGGPVTVEWRGQQVLAGIVSQGDIQGGVNICTTGEGGNDKHTRVSHYIDWILSNIIVSGYFDVPCLL